MPQMSVDWYKMLIIGFDLKFILCKQNVGHEQSFASNRWYKMLTIPLALMFVNWCTYLGTKC